MKLSYAILTHNETDSLLKLIEFLVKHKDEKDEIVILDDYSDNEKTKEILDTMCSIHEIKFEKRHLMKDFAQQKNYLNSLCSGRYIFNLDADELPPKYLLDNIHIICSENDCDLYWVPRVNTVEGLTQEHIDKWRWNVNEQGWVNFPDYQARLYKNIDYIKWVRPVHEIVEGSKTHTYLPKEELFSIRHHKDIKTQEHQNNLYSKIIKEI